jgi:hypothetical protein
MSSVTVRPQDRVKLGSILAAIGNEVGGVDLDIERDKMPNAPPIPSDTHSRHAQSPPS